MSQVKYNGSLDFGNSNGIGEKQEGCKIYLGDRPNRPSCLISSKDNTWPSGLGTWTGKLEEGGDGGDSRSSLRHRQKIVPD